MSETVLIAETGRATGDGPSRRLRAQERIPAVVYGMGMDPISISVPWRELRKGLAGPAGLNTIFDLEVDGATYPTLVKDLQRHPVRRDVLHVDFIQINLSEEVSVTVPLHLEGEAKEVEREGGFVDQVMVELNVVTTPRNIPNEIMVDISGLTMDAPLTVADLTLPTGVTADDDPEAAVAVGSYPTAAVTEAPTEGDEGEAAEGEAEAAEAAEAGDDDAGDSDAGE